MPTALSLRWLRCGEQWQSSIGLNAGLPGSAPVACHLAGGAFSIHNCFIFFSLKLRKDTKDFLWLLAPLGEIGAYWMFSIESGLINDTMSAVGFETVKPMWATAKTPAIVNMYWTDIGYENWWKLLKTHGKRWDLPKLAISLFKVMSLYFSNIHIRDTQIGRWFCELYI